MGRAGHIASCRPPAGTGVVESPFACAGRDMTTAPENIDERIWQVAPDFFSPGRLDFGLGMLCGDETAKPEFDGFSLSQT